MGNAKGIHYSRSGNTDSFRIEMVNARQNEEGGVFYFHLTWFSNGFGVSFDNVNIYLVKGYGRTL